MKDIMFIIMLASLANFLAGSIMGPSSELEEARGFVGYSGIVLKTGSQLIASLVAKSKTSFPSSPFISRQVSVFLLEPMFPVT